MEGFLPLFMALVGVIGVIYLSYIVSRYIAKGTSKLSSAKYIKAIDRVILGPDRMLLIVMIGEKYYLMGSTSESINILKELSPEDLIPVLPSSNGTTTGIKSFQDVLKGITSKKDKGR